MNDRPLNRLSLAGLSATLIGNGIGRFAFIALMPALVQGGWFTKGEASYLSVATLVGYLLGAWGADWLGTRFRVSTLLRGSMLACSLSFFACALQGAGMPWYYVWRVGAGFCGALLMVLPAPAVLAQHSPAIRGRVSGIVFSGIGLGAVISGALVPVLISGIGLAVISAGTLVPLVELQGITGAWLGMGAICLVLTALSWQQWPHDAPLTAASAPDAATHAALPAAVRSTVWLVVAAHSLNAVGYLAHTLFWVDYVVRELHMPLATGGFYWAMFGLGAAIGPLLTGTLADMFGLRRCLIAGFLIKSFSAWLPLLSSHPLALFASSILMGIFTPGIVAMISAYLLDRVGPKLHRRNWGLATFGFAIAQAVGGFLMALAAVRLDSYQPLFVVSAVALIGSILCISLIRDRSTITDENKHAAEALTPARTGILVE